ncbi:hypothetical protein [uncultured Campylobacter sp.]|uniref:hypothetical protein n=1 Tax=uncultured Campylobacter sp. TaxID=218934 RepID=UPI002603BA1E|nr:hypothetical protein [uncultured Campylobacter sp.]
MNSYFSSEMFFILADDSNPSKQKTIFLRGVELPPLVAFASNRRRFASVVKQNVTSVLKVRSA